MGVKVRQEQPQASDQLHNKDIQFHFNFNFLHKSSLQLIKMSEPATMDTGGSPSPDTDCVGSAEVLVCVDNNLKLPARILIELHQKSHH